MVNDIHIVSLSSVSFSIVATPPAHSASYFCASCSCPSALGIICQILNPFRAGDTAAYSLTWRSVSWGIMEAKRKKSQKLNSHFMDTKDLRLLLQGFNTVNKSSHMQTSHKDPTLSERPPN